MKPNTKSEKKGLAKISKIMKARKKKVPYKDYGNLDEVDREFQTHI